MVAAAMGVVAVSVTVTLYLTGVLGFTETHDPHQNHTFADAVLACQGRAQQAFRDSGAVITVDDLSSRFDVASSQYRVFIRVQLLERDRKGETQSFFISCYFNAFRGKVVHFERLRDRDAPREPVPKDGGGRGLFGWPR